MLIRTITKTIRLVILVSVSVGSFVGCSTNTFGDGETTPADGKGSEFEKPVVVSRLVSKEVNESSGLAVSRCQNDVFWTHNDSGGGPLIFAFSSDGKPLGTWRVEAATNYDWEDIATVKSPSGECFLYIGDIGDNEKKFDVHFVYRVREPTVEPGAAPRKEPRSTEPAELLRYRYPTERQNAETLLVHPETLAAYVLTKRFDAASEIYKLRPVFKPDDVQLAQLVGAISLPALPDGVVTGGDISQDGMRLILCDYYSGYEFALSLLAKRFDEIWSEKPVVIDLGKRDQGESVAYSLDANSVFATTEDLHSPLFRTDRKPTK